MIDAIFYILIFCIGTVFGSFFTLAVYRIPLHQDITHKRSYCPNCNHRLSFFDMIPVLSYIFLSGKCRYCKQKIRPRYLILEILTGLLFLSFALSINLNIENINISQITYLVFGLLYIVGLIIIAGIDKENYKIEKSLILYETIVSSLYMIYLYTLEDTNIYRYVIYLFILVVFMIFENCYLRKKLKDSYIIEILELSLIMVLFNHEFTVIYTIIGTLLSIAFNCILLNIVKNKNKVAKKTSKFFIDLPIGFYLCSCNIIVMIVLNFLAFRGGKIF